MITTDIMVECPNCHVRIRCPYIPYNCEGKLVSLEEEISCPKCGYPIKISIKGG